MAGYWPPWTDQEKKILRNHSLTLSEMSALTGRTYPACSKRRILLSLPPLRRTLRPKHLPDRLNDAQTNLLVGSLFGDGSLGKKRDGVTYSFRVEQVKKDMVLGKAKMLNSFVPLSNGQPKIQYCPSRDSYSFRTFTHSIFSHYHSVFYPNNKREVTQENVMLLNLESFAHLMFDDGTLRNGKYTKYYQIATCSFGKSGNSLLCKRIKELGFPTVHARVFRSNQNSATYHILSFRTDDTESISNLLKNFIRRNPLWHEMSYKVTDYKKP